MEQLREERNAAGRNPLCFDIYAEVAGTAR
jgi:hypothetical protein